MNIIQSGIPNSKDIVGAKPKITELEMHVRNATDLATLLSTVAYLTRDRSILKHDWRPADLSGAPKCQVNARTEAEIKQICLKKLTEFFAAEFDVPPVSYDMIREIGEWYIGATVEPYVHLLAEEFVINGNDLRKPDWSKEIIAKERSFHVAIVGAGESGLIAAIRLKQAGIPFTIYERNADLGGTWLSNHYPGCRVDINSFVYSYAGYPKVWDEYFGKQENVLSYLRDVAVKEGLLPHIRFGVAVEKATWQEESSSWLLETFEGGAKQTLKSNVVVFAVGQLNRPKLPAVSGLDRFAGPSFHSANWNHDVDLTGKTVGVIGTGASAFQVIPQAAKVATRTHVFMRTAAWLLPTPELHEETGESARWLMKHVPGYINWYRAGLLVLQVPGMLDQVKVDSAYHASEKAVSGGNEALRDRMAESIESQLSDRPDLIPHLLPNAPVGAKRILRDNGSWIATLKQPNVELHVGRIEEITESGILLASGEETKLDCIIYCTGFYASKFLFPIEVVGKDDTRLEDFWHDGPRAYLGSTIPNFPNMFCMYGPNTNLVVHGGSIVLYSELTTKYIVSAVYNLLSSGYGSMEVKREVYETYNGRVDRENYQRAWGFSNVNSWYKNENGRVTQNYPFSAAEFFNRTDHVVVSEYDFR